MLDGIYDGVSRVTTFPTLLGPVLVWNQWSYLRLLLRFRYIEFSKSCFS